MIKFEMTPVQFVEEMVNLDVLNKSIESALAEAVNYDNLEDGVYSAYVTDVVSGAHGHYQYQFMAQFFCGALEIDEDDYESIPWVIEAIDEYAGKVAELITERLNLVGNLGFGYLEADSSYGLFYYVNEEDVPSVA